ncbi:MOB kinase activator 3C [Plecturocebus cupreus]
MPDKDIGGVPFPKNFQQVCTKILTRLFRVFVHVYIHHFDSILSMGAEAHVNTCYKHFYYFIREFSLVDQRELEPLNLQTWFLRSEAKHKIILQSKELVELELGTLESCLPSQDTENIDNKAEHGGSCLLSEHFGMLRAFKNPFLGRARWLMPVIPAFWEAEAEESRAQEFKSSLTNNVKTRLY